MNRQTWKRARKEYRQYVSYSSYYSRKRCRFFEGVPVHIYNGVPDDKVIPVYYQRPLLIERQPVQIFEKPKPMEFDSIFWRQRFGL
jgi:hypothetical protein